MRVLSLSDLVARLPSVAPRPGATQVLAVDGPSGSGKTTLAGRLADVLAAPVVHLDDIYPGWDGLAAAPGLLVEQVLSPLAAGERARFRRWDWEADRWGETCYVPTAEVLVVEGVGSAAAACEPYLAATVWIEAPRALRMRRGIERDGEAYRPHWERWAAQERDLFARDRTRERADVLLDGSGSVPHDPEREVVLLEP